MSTFLVSADLVPVYFIYLRSNSKVGTLFGSQEHGIIILLFVY